MKVTMIPVLGGELATVLEDLESRLNWFGLVWFGFMAYQPLLVI